ncbi:unnamed protein product [Clonostachys byssicola]|uniref:Uncharacterized protein n=1 Tax=Clonostachys byssicola TaxID=160290 RepID=A0A9N9UVY8_9HYPO|nr:unnamed protein product [Clonostachys byssicola]
MHLAERLETFRKRKVAKLVLIVSIAPGQDHVIAKGHILQSNIIITRLQLGAVHLASDMIHDGGYLVVLFRQHFALPVEDLLEPEGEYEVGRIVKGLSCMIPCTAANEGSLCSEAPRAIFIPVTMKTGSLYWHAIIRDLTL